MLSGATIYPLKKIAFTNKALAFGTTLELAIGTSLEKELSPSIPCSRNRRYG